MGYGCNPGYTEDQTISQICTRQWLGSLTESSSEELGKFVKLEELCEQEDCEAAVKEFMAENQAVIEKVLMHLLEREPEDYLSNYPEKRNRVILFMRQPHLYECFTEPFQSKLDEQILSA